MLILFLIWSELRQNNTIIRSKSEQQNERQKQQGTQFNNAGEGFAC